MKREFNIGDIAHLAKGKRVRGILDFNTEQESYKDFNLKWKDEAEIVGYSKADEKACGGWVYDYNATHKGVTYRVECISQFDLVSKKMWEDGLELDRKIKELQGS